MTLTTRYSDQETALLEQLHKAGQSLEQIATSLNRSVRSVRAKLSSLGLYHRAPYTSKNGEIPKKKEEYVKEIARILEVDEFLVDSLEKCTKFTLKKLLDKLSDNE